MRIGISQKARALSIAGALAVGVALAVVGEWHFGHVAREFLWVAGGGVLVGVGMGALFSWVNRFVRDIPVLFVTAIDDEEAGRLEALAPVIRKPFDFIDFADAVRAQLDAAAST